MTRVINAELMVKCPRNARDYVGWAECKMCTYNKFWEITKYAVECGYDSSIQTKTEKEEK